MNPEHYQPLNTTEKLNFAAIPAWLIELASCLRSQNYQVFLVGGAVRDLLWGEVPHDWDLATDALPWEVEQLFSNVVPTGKQYGTVTIIQAEHGVEITTLREEVGFSDGRRPDAIRFTTDIIVDLARRDFTVNAIAYDFARAQLIDPFQGRQDCYQRILKAVGEPRLRFVEDGLRMLRFFRFLATSELRPDRQTLKAINPEWLIPISKERIRDEFSKLLVGKRVRQGLNGLWKSGLLQMFLPELALCSQVNQGLHHRWDLWEHLLICTETIPPQLHLRLAALFHDIAKPQSRFTDLAGVHFYGHDQTGAELSRQILTRMRYPSKTVEKVTTLIRWHMFFLPTPTNDSAIRRLIARVGPENLPALLQLRQADLVATGRSDAKTWESWQELSHHILEILQAKPVTKPAELAIKGNDLITQFALKPGPLIGEILHHLLELILEEPSLNQKTLLLERAKTYLEKL